MFQNELNTLHLNPKGNGSLALNFINKIRRLRWSSEHLNVPTIVTVVIVSLFNVDAKNKVKNYNKKEIIVYIINYNI